MATKSTMDKGTKDKVKAKKSMGLNLVKKPKEYVTVKKLKEMFPTKSRTITQETVDLVNEASNDPEFNADEFIDSMYDYQNVMLKNKCSIKQFIRALKFCAYIESEDDNYIQAYKKARADEEFVRERIHAPSGSKEYQELAQAAHRYRKTPLVRDILTQADMPLYLMFQGGRFRAATVLLEEMHNAPHARDRISAADKFLTHVKPPEEPKVDIGITINKNPIIDRYEEAISAMVEAQKVRIANGEDLKTVANLDIIDNSNNIIDVEEE